MTQTSTRSDDLSDSFNDENKEIRIISVGFFDFEDLKQDKNRSN